MTELLSITLFYENFSVVRRFFFPGDKQHVNVPSFYGGNHLGKQRRPETIVLRKVSLQNGPWELARVPDIFRIYKVAPSLFLGFLYSIVYAEDLLLF